VVIVLVHAKLAFVSNTVMPWVLFFLGSQVLASMVAIVSDSATQLSVTNIWMVLWLMSVKTVL